MKVRHGAMLLAIGLLTLAIGAVVGVDTPNRWIPAKAALLKPVLLMSGGVEGTDVPVDAATGAKHSQRLDDELKEQIQKALDEDWGLHRTDIVVDTVARGVVALSGEAETISHHIRAVELVANFSGVQGVKSHVHVPGALSGVDIWRDAHETNKRGAFGNAWITVPIKDDTAGQQ